MEYKVNEFDSFTTGMCLEIGPDKTSDDKQPKWLQKRDQDKVRGWKQWRTSSTLEQSSLTKDQNPRFFPG